MSKPVSPLPRSLTEILNDPLSNLRITMAGKTGAILAGQTKITKAELDQTLQTLSINAGMRAEVAKISAYLDEKTPSSAPDLSQPHAQLAWGVALLYLISNKKFPSDNITDKPIWKALRDAQSTKFEVARNAFLLYEGLRNPRTQIGWGDPGSWFYFNPAENRINLDLLYGLIAGFEHARSVTMHEIGHSQLTVAWTPNMQKIHEEMTAIQKKGRERGKNGKPTFKPEEYVRLVRLSVEWNMRFRLFNSAEDNCVNRYAATMGQFMAQDFGHSLNHISATIASTGQIGRHQGEVKTPGIPGEEGDKMAQAMKKHQNLCHAVNMSFFCNNGLFPDNPAGWGQVKVDTNLIGPWTQLLANQNDAQAAGAIKSDPKSFDALRDMLAGPRGVEHSQPKPRERLYGKVYYDHQVDKHAATRNEIIDRIWDLHLKDDLEPVFKNAEEKAEETLKQIQENAKNKQKGQKGDSDAEIDMGDQEGEGEGEGKKEGKKGKKKQHEENKTGKGAGEEGDKEQNAEIEGGGEAPEVGTPPEDPKGDDPSSDADADGDLEDAMDEDGDDDEADGEGDTPGKPGKKPSRKPSNQAGNQNGTNFNDLPTGDFANYQAEVKRLTAPIRQVARNLKKIRDHQLEELRETARRFEKLPEDGEVDRLNQGRHMDFRVKRITGQKIEEPDFERFHVDQDKIIPATIEVVLLIDGSGSMSSEDGVGKSRMERALQAAMVIYEAARLVGGINVYVGAWGPSNPEFFARPGDDHKTIGANFVRLKKGLNSGTNLAPAIKKTTETLAQTRDAPGTMVGYTHLFVISDGEVYDLEQTRTLIDTLFQSCRHVTVDTAIIGNDRATSLENLAKENLGAGRRDQKIGVMRTIDADKLATGIVGILLQKIRSCRSFLAEPQAKKRDAFKRAANRMGLKP